MATFTPRAPEQRTGSKFFLFPKGNYGFVVTEAKDGHSKAGNEMVILTIKFFGDPDTPLAGKTVTVTDHLTFTDDSIWKAEGFCAATGLMDAYESGNLTAAVCLGKEGRALIKPEKKQNGFEQNAVVEYIPAKPATDETVPSSKPGLPGVPDGDDEDGIPF